MTHPCPNCKADAEITEHIRFPGAFGSSSPIRPDRLILDCPNCGHVTVAIAAALITMLVRFRTQAVASVTATLASAIESTIESRVSRLLGDFIEKTSGA